MHNYPFLNTTVYIYASSYCLPQLADINQSQSPDKLYNSALLNPLLYSLNMHTKLVHNEMLLSAY